MGVSTDAIICFGIPLPEEGVDDLPWNDENYQTDFESWLQDQYKGRTVPGVELVSHCSNEYPMFILALPQTVLTAFRGSPKMFDPIALNLQAKDPAAVNALINFFIKHNLPHDGPLKPEWYLASDWS